MWGSDFPKVGWKTKRKGKVAYLTNGRPMPKSQGFVPCFVRRSEIEAAAVDIPEHGVVDHRW